MRCHWDLVLGDIRQPRGRPEESLRAGVRASLSCPGSRVPTRGPLEGGVRVVATRGQPRAARLHLREGLEPRAERVWTAAARSLFDGLATALAFRGSMNARNRRGGVAKSLTKVGDDGTSPGDRDGELPRTSTTSAVQEAQVTETSLLLMHSRHVLPKRGASRWHLARRGDLEPLRSTHDCS
jgi:hypothetical protein